MTPSDKFPSYLNQFTKLDCSVIKSILLLGDDADDADLVQHIISEFNGSINFYNAWEGSEAIRMLQSGDIEAPDLILLDINMPGMDGWNFLEIIKAESALNSIPVIMYTTSSAKKEIDEAKRLGAAGYIAKPNEYLCTKQLLRMLVSNPVSEYKNASANLDAETQRSIHFLA